MKYAGGNLQMSSAWRKKAAEKFLANQPHAGGLLGILLGNDRHGEKELKEAFKRLLLHHRKAIIIPVGAHFDTIGTDIDFLSEVYTCSFPPQLLY